MFVDIVKKLCFSEKCLRKFSTLNATDRAVAWCEHLKEGELATKEARQIDVTLASLKELKLDKDDYNLVESQCVNSVITCYEVNTHTVVTPTFSSLSVNGVIGLTHVKDLVCKLKDCKAIKAPHALSKRTEKICLHNSIVLKCGVVSNIKVVKEVMNKIDHIREAVKSKVGYVSCKEKQLHKLGQSKALSFLEL